MRRCWRLLLIAPTVLLAGCTWLGVGVEDKCAVTVAHTASSPDGQMQAIESRQTCGNWYYSTVEVSGNGLDKATAFHGQPVNNPKPPVWPELKVEWKSARELWVTYPKDLYSTCVGSIEGKVEVHCIDGSTAR
jgi:hypothetical protein